MVTVILGNSTAGTSTWSQGCLSHWAAPLLQLPDKLQEVHLQRQLLGYKRGAVRASMTLHALLPLPKTRDKKMAGSEAKESVFLWKLAMVRQKGGGLAPSRQGQQSLAYLEWQQEASRQEGGRSLCKVGQVGIASVLAYSLLWEWGLASALHSAFHPTSVHH